MFSEEARKRVEEAIKVENCEEVTVLVSDLKNLYNSFNNANDYIADLLDEPKEIDELS